MHKSRLNVLIFLRQNYIEHVGGDVIQAQKTADALKCLGHKVDIIDHTSVDLSNYDIVHLFNLERPIETLQHLSYAKKSNKPVLLSPIFWDSFAVAGYPSFPRRMIVILKIFCKCLCDYFKTGNFTFHEKAIELLPSRFRHVQQDILEQIDCLLPNTHAEQQMLAQTFSGASNISCHIVPNGYDKTLFNSEKIKKIDVKQARAVIEVARIEERKNQLLLVRAMSNTDVPVVLVGNVGNAKYADAVFAAMKPKDQYIDKVPYEQLPEVYSKCSVNVLPSYWEVCGLTTMESGAIGCNQVASDIPTVREYYKDIAEFCNPSDEKSIRDAIFRALKKPYPNMDIARKIRQKYSWENAAKETEKAYFMALDHMRS